MADLASGKPTGEVNAWGAALSSFVVFLLINLISKHRKKISAWIEKFTTSSLIKATLVGVVFAEITEIIYFPFNPLYPGVTLVADIFLTMPIYIFVHIFWFYTVRKYQFSEREVFFSRRRCSWND